jgi:excisionase family DNA binding protein
MRRARDRQLATVRPNSIATSGRASAQTDRLTMAHIGREQLLTVSAAAECVGCCEETIRRAYLARQLDVLRYGSRRVRIRRSELFAWLERGGKTTAA